MEAYIIHTISVDHYQTTHQHILTMLSAIFAYWPDSKEMERPVNNVMIMFGIIHLLFSYHVSEVYQNTSELKLFIGDVISVFCNVGL